MNNFSKLLLIIIVSFVLTSCETTREPFGLKANKYFIEAYMEMPNNQPKALVSCTTTDIKMYPNGVAYTLVGKGIPVEELINVYPYKKFEILSSDKVFEWKRDNLSTSICHVMLQENLKTKFELQEGIETAENNRKNTCNNFGFKEGTEAHSQCMLDLYKLEVQSKQNFQMQQTIQNNAAKQQAILEQQLREQEFNNGMMLLQQSADIFNSLSQSSTTSTTVSPTKIKPFNCKFNNYNQTVSCF